jgi:hypothetical protein
MRNAIFTLAAVVVAFVILGAAVRSHSTTDAVPPGKTAAMDAYAIESTIDVKSLPRGDVDLGNRP